MSEQFFELQSLALTPTWSVATVLTIFVGVSLLVERSIHRLSSWLKKTLRNPLYEALEKMKEVLMLLGFISLLLAATSRMISNICIDSKFYNSTFSPCSLSDVEDNANTENDSTQGHKQQMGYIIHLSIKRALTEVSHKTCSEGYEPFVSYEGLEQLHRFIFVMAITHVSYICLTMLLAIVKIRTWRSWEDEARRVQYDSYSAEITRALTFRRQSSFINSRSSRSWNKNNFIIWVTCFFRQFGKSVVRADYLTLRRGFIMNHNLTAKYDFHGYMIRSMEEEFKRIVGLSAPLWGFVVAFMMFNIKGSNLYFWIAIIPITLVLLVGTKLQHVIATLALESAGLNGSEGRLKPRDDLFWFKKPELILSLIHFILFQNAFELASFLWFWWQFGYDSCYITNHFLVYCRLMTVVGIEGGRKMGSNYKAALLPQRIRETIHGWGKAARKKRKHGRGIDESTIYTETSTVCSLEEDEERLMEDPTGDAYIEIELLATPKNATATTSADDATVGNESSYSNACVPLLIHSSSLPSSPAVSDRGNFVSRCASMPIWRVPKDV